MSYTFQDDVPIVTTRKHRKSGKSRQSSSSGQQSDYGGNQPQGDDNSKCGSLTYSASSSVAGSSAAGESTDSSFADIMKVLDDSSELALLMTKEGNEEMRQLFEQAEHGRPGMRGHRSVNSMASSLQYSEDGESAYEPASAMAGQPSDSNGHDGGGLGGNIIFEAASYEENSQNKRNKRQGSKQQRSKNGGSSSRKIKDESSNSSRGMSRSSPLTISDGSTSTPPTSPPPRGSSRKSRSIGSPARGSSKKPEIWYNQWWMCGFADAISLSSDKKA